MATFEIQGADGQIYEVQADTMEAAAQALSSVTSGQPVGGSATNSQAVGELSDKLGATARGLHNQAFAGFGDNVNGAMGAIAGNDYARTRDTYRTDLRQAQVDHPEDVAAGSIIGATLLSLATGGLGTGASTLGTMGRGAMLGAVEGGLQGAGNADGQNVLANAGRGAGLGLLIGGAAPAVVGAAGAAKNAVKNPTTGVIDSMFGIANGRKANDAVLGALRSSGNKADDIAAMLAKAAQQGQPEFRLMDALGASGQRQASGLARQGGDAGTEIADFLKQRQLDQGDRVGGFVEDAFGLRGTTAAKTTDGLNAARKATNYTNYTDARAGAGPVDLSGTVETIDTLMKRNPIIGDSALTNTEVGARLSGLRGKVTDDKSLLMDFDTVLNVKEDLGRTIKRIKKSGEEVPHDIAQVYGALDSALEVASGSYRAANTAALEGRKAVAAVDEGAEMAKGGRYGDNVPAFNAMNPAQQGAARIGYGDDLMGKLERVTAPTANRAAPLRSTKRVNEADAMTLDPALYRDRLGRENTMWETQNRALGGSRTADNMADQEAMSQLAGGAMDAAKSAANLQFGDTVAKIGSMLGPIAKGQNDATRQLIAKALMSGDSSVLAPALRQSATSESKRRMIEALLRQTTREGVNALGRQ